MPVFFTEFGKDLAFLSTRKPNIHRHQDWKHGECNQSRPLKKKSNHDEDETDVLRMAHVGVRTPRRQRMRALRLVKNFPRRREQDEAAEDENVAEQMERIEMRVAPPAKDRVPQMAGVMRERIEAWITSYQPP